MVHAEDILEAILEFYERERAGAVEAKKIWARSTATPIPGAGLVRPSYEQSPHLLAAAPSSHVSVRDIMEFCAHLMFKDYYCNGARVGAGAGKYPEIYGILKKATGHAVFVRGFGKRLERLRKKVVADQAARAHNGFARDYYDAFMMGMADWQVGVRTTPAAWAAAVEGVRAKYSAVAAAAAAEPAQVTAAAPEVAPVLTSEVPVVAPAPAPVPAPVPEFVETTEEDARAAVAALKASQPGWFGGFFKGWW